MSHRLARGRETPRDEVDTAAPNRAGTDDDGPIGGTAHAHTPDHEPPGSGGACPRATHTCDSTTPRGSPAPHRRRRRWT